MFENIHLYSSRHFSVVCRQHDTGEAVRTQGLWVPVSANQWEKGNSLPPSSCVSNSNTRSNISSFVTGKSQTCCCHIWVCFKTFVNSHKAKNKKGSLPFLIWSAIQEQSEFLQYCKVHMVNSERSFQENRVLVKSFVILWAHFKIIKKDL